MVILKGTLNEMKDDRYSRLFHLLILHMRLCLFCVLRIHTLVYLANTDDHSISAVHILLKVQLQIIFGDVLHKRYTIHLCLEIFQI